MDIKRILQVVVSLFIYSVIYGQADIDSSFLTIDRLYASTEFRQERMQAIQWTDDGNSYVIVEYNDGQLTKMTTDQLLEEHTESFLEALETMVSSKVKIR